MEGYAARLTIMNPAMIEKQCRYRVKIDKIDNGMYYNFGSFVRFGARIRCCPRRLSIF
jgi:hypothetical protein